MQNDFMSNNEAVLVLSRASSITAGTTGQTNAYDCLNTSGASFVVLVDEKAAGTTIDLVLQYSDDDITYTNETNSNEGNEPQVSIEATDTVGVYLIHCPNARARYIRVEYTTAVSTCSLSVLAVSNSLFYK